VAAYAAPPSLEAPPASLDVQEQQGPAAQFAQNYQQPPGQQAGGQGVNAMALAEQKLNQVASDLKEVAKLLVTSKPNLMPILQKMAQAGSMLMSEIQAGKPGGQQGQPGAQRSAPEPPGGGAPSMSPPDEGAQPAIG